MSPVVWGCPRDRPSCREVVSSGRKTGAWALPSPVVRDSRFNPCGAAIQSPPSLSLELPPALSGLGASVRAHEKLPGPRTGQKNVWTCPRSLRAGERAGSARNWGGRARTASGEPAEPCPMAASRTRKAIASVGKNCGFGTNAPEGPPQQWANREKKTGLDWRDLGRRCQVRISDK